LGNYYNSCVSKREEEKEMTIAFNFTVDDALEFFMRCKDANADTEEERLGIIKQMLLEGRKIGAFRTNRSPDEIAKDYAKHGKVLQIKRKEDDNGRK
jgi:hypothetical protein